MFAKETTPLATTTLKIHNQIQATNTMSCICIDFVCFSTKIFSYFFVFFVRIANSKTTVLQFDLNLKYLHIRNRSIFKEMIQMYFAV